MGAAPFGFKGAVLLSCLRVPHPSRPSAQAELAPKKKSRRVGLCPCSPGCPAARRESAIIERRSRDPGAFVAPPSRRHPWHRHSCLCAPFVVAVIPSPARDLQFGWSCGCTRVCPELAPKKSREGWVLALVFVAPPSRRHPRHRHREPRTRVLKASTRALKKSRMLGWSACAAQITCWPHV